jgi:hypothetical protein
MNQKLKLGRGKIIGEYKKRVKMEQNGLKSFMMIKKIIGFF